jgi:hypothetical protein
VFILNSTYTPRGGGRGGHTLFISKQISRIKETAAISVSGIFCTWIYNLSGKIFRKY